MIELTIPGRGLIQLEYLVSDVNGTLAIDGQLIEGLARELRILRDRLEIHLLTADTHGKQAAIDLQLGTQAVRIPPGDEAGQKAEYVRKLGANRVVAIGQGANDAAMLKKRPWASVSSRSRAWRSKLCWPPTSSCPTSLPPWRCWKNLYASWQPYENELTADRTNPR